MQARQNDQSDQPTPSPTQAVVTAPPTTQVSGQMPGQMTGQIPGQVPGQMPVQVPGQMPGQVSAAPQTPSSSSQDNPNMFSEADINKLQVLITDLNDNKLYCPKLSY